MAAKRTEDCYDILMPLESLIGKKRLEAFEKAFLEERRYTDAYWKDVAKAVAEEMRRFGAVLSIRKGVLGIVFYAVPEKDDEDILDGADAFFPLANMLSGELKLETDEHLASLKKILVEATAAIDAEIDRRQKEDLAEGPI